MMRTEIALRREKDAEAREHVLEALRVDPSHAHARALLAQIGIVRGERPSIWKAHAEAAAASDPGDRHLAGVARHARILSHPLLAPTRVAIELGHVWSTVWIIGIFVSHALGFVFWLAWVGLGLAFAGYSALTYKIIERRYERDHGR